MSTSVLSSDTPLFTLSLYMAHVRYEYTIEYIIYCFGGRAWPVYTVPDPPRLIHVHRLGQ